MLSYGRNAKLTLEHCNYILGYHKLYLCRRNFKPKKFKIFKQDHGFISLGDMSVLRNVRAMERIIVDIII